MKKLFHLVFVLTTICVLSGLALSIVYEMTRERIANVETERRLKAIHNVLPPEGGDTESVAVVDPERGITNIYYITRQDNGTLAGVATEAFSPNGYAGDIRLMVGFNHFSELQAIDILEHRETPGLGAKISGDQFKADYAGRALFSTKWALRKDGGDLDGITAATISSRAVAEAVKEAVSRYLRDKDQLIPEPEPPLRLEDLLENPINEIH